jgi:hypothetical protein
MSYYEYLYLEGGPTIDRLGCALVNPVDEVELYTEVGKCLYRRTERLMGDCTVFEFIKVTEPSQFTIDCDEKFEVWWKARQEDYEYPKIPSAFKDTAKGIWGAAYCKGWSDRP